MCLGLFQSVAQGSEDSSVESAGSFMKCVTHIFKYFVK